MKSLIPPPINDIRITSVLSDNTRLSRTSFPHLKNELCAVTNGYKDYENQKGNALSVANVGISEELSEGLKKNYKNPPTEISFVKSIRRSSPSVCPMCGSLKTSTLDHLFPKDDYPCFAIFSKNLVPACDCNSKRGITLLDGDKRILHPYYDLFLNDRLLSCRIIPDNEFPLVRIELHYEQPDHAEFESIRFHAEKIVLPSGLINWLESEWDTTTLAPFSKIQTLPIGRPIDIEECKNCLEDALMRHDVGFGTPNNWFSIFTHGVLHSEGVIEFLTYQHNHNFLVDLTRIHER